MSLEYINLSKIYSAISGFSTNHLDASSPSVSDLEREIKSLYTLNWKGNALVDARSLQGRLIRQLRERKEEDPRLINARWAALFRSAFSVDRRLPKLTLKQRHLYLKLKCKYLPIESSQVDAKLKAILKRSESESAFLEVIGSSDYLQEIERHSLLRGADLKSDRRVPLEFLSILSETQGASASPIVEEFFSYISSYLKASDGESEIKGAAETACSIDGALLVQAGLNSIERGKDERDLSHKALFLKAMEDLVAAVGEMPVGGRKLLFSACQGRAPEMRIPSSNSPIISKIKEIFEGTVDDGSLKKNITETILALLKEVRSLSLGIDVQKIRAILSGKIVETVCPLLAKSLWDNRSLGMKAALAPFEFLRYATEQEVAAFALDMSDSFAKDIVSDISSKKLLSLLEILSSEENCRAHVEKWVEEAIGNLKTLLLQTWSNSLSLLPSSVTTVLSGIGFGDFGAPSGSVWLEIIRETDRTFTLVAYGLEADSKGGVPLVYKGVPLEKVSNPRFFSSFFSYRGLSHCQGNKTKEDILNGTLGFLRVKCERLPREEGVDGSPTSPWGLLQEYINLRTKFFSVKDRELFYFNLKKKLFLDVWYGLKKSSEPFEASDRACFTLECFGEALLKEALSLFEKTYISKEILKAIYCTISDLKIMTHDLRSRQADRQVSSLIPREILPQLQQLCYSMEGRASREVIATLIAGAFGDDLYHLVREMRDDLIPVPIEARAIPPLPVKPEGFARRMGQWILREIDSQLHYLGVGSADFESLYKRPTPFRVISMIIRIASLIFAPSATLKIVVSAIAFRALTQMIRYCFPRPVHALERCAHHLFMIRNKYLARLFAYLFFTGEEIDALNHLIAQWRALLLRKGELSYEVAAPLSSRTVSLHSSSPSLPSPPERVEGAHSGILRISGLAFRLQPKRVLLNEGNLVENLTEWVQKLKSFKNVPNIRVFNFLKTQLRDLPVPSKQREGDCWDRVADYSKCLDLLTELAFYFYGSAQRVLPDEEHFSAFVVLLFKVYAVVDKLAHRCPKSHLKGYTSNPWALAFWSQSLPEPLIDPVLKSQLKKLLAYHGIDSNKVYKQEEVDTLAKTSLFYFKYESEGCSNFQSDVKVVLDRSPQTRYYTRLLEDGEIQSKLLLAGLEGASTLDKVSALFANISVPVTVRDSKELKEREDASGGSVTYESILPHAFQRLRLMDLIANKALDSHEIKFPFEDIDGLSYRVIEKNHPVLDTWDKAVGLVLGAHRVSAAPKEKRWRRVLRAYTTLFGPTVSDVYQLRHLRIRYLFSKPALSKKLPFHWLAIFLSPEKRTQEPVLNAPSVAAKSMSLQSFHESRSQICALEMVVQDPSMQVVNVLSFLRQQIPLLNKQEYLALLYGLLFQGDFLIEQLKVHPQFGLGRFFDEAIQYHLSDENVSVVLELIRIGILSQVQAEAVTREFLDYPHFRDLILSLSVRYPGPVYQKLYRDLLVLPYFIRYPDECSEEEVENAVFALGLSLVCHPEKSTLEDTDCLYMETMILWYPRMKAFLDNDLHRDTREMLLNRIASMKGWVRPGNERVAWEGRFPEYRSSLGTISFDYAVFGKSSKIAESSLSHYATQVIELIFSKEQEKEEGNEPVRIFSIDEGVLKLPRENITLSLESSERKREAAEGVKLRVTKEFRGKVFLLTCLSGLPFEKVGNKTTYWVEESDAVLKELLILEAGKFKELRQIRLDGVRGPGERSYTLSVRELIDEAELYVEIDVSREAFGLHLLGCFESLSTIRAFALKRDPRVIKKIELTKSGLTLEVRHVRGSYQAVNEELVPRFFVSKKQNLEGVIPLRYRFSSYLIWENGQGKYKLMVRSQALLGKAITLFSGSIGSITIPPFIESQLEGALFDGLEIDKLLKKIPTLLVYDIGNEGELTSDDPESLIYLFVFDLLEKNFIGAERHLSKIERLSRSRLLSPSFVKISLLIETCALGMDNRSITLFALRLAALREENEKTQHETPVEGDPSILQVISWGVVQTHCLKYLRNDGLRGGLTEFQELFVLSHIAEGSHALLKKYKNRLGIDSLLSHTGNRFLHFFKLETLAETFLVHPLLMNRYLFLLRMHGIQNVEEVNFREYIRNYFLDRSQIEIPGLRMGGGLDLSTKVFTGIFQNNASFTFSFSFEKIKTNLNWESEVKFTFLEDPSSLNSHFHLYYFLAKNEIPDHKKSDGRWVKWFLEEVERFQEELFLSSSKDYDWFKAVVKHPRFFPSAQELYDAVMRVEGLRHDSRRIIEEASKGPFSRDFKEKSELIDSEFSKACDYVRNMLINFSTIYRMLSTFSILDSAELNRFCSNTRNPYELLKTGGAVTKGVVVSKVAKIVSVANLGLRLYNTLLQVKHDKQKIRTLIAARKTALSQEGPLLPEVQKILFEEDREWEALFRSHHARAFVMIDEKEVKEVEIKPFSSALTSSLVVERFKRLNKSLDEFYARRSRKNPSYRPRGIRELEELVFLLKKSSDLLSHRLEDEKLAIVRWTTLPREVLDPNSELSFDFLKDATAKFSNISVEHLFKQLLDFFLSNDCKEASDPSHRLPAFITLKKREIPHLYLSLHRYLLRASRLEQLLRSRDLLEQAIESGLPPSDDKMKSMLESFSSELLRERGYRFDVKSEKLFKGYQVFEYQAKIMLRSAQVPQIERMLLGDDGRAVLEMQPGSGKTALSPLISFFASNGKRVLQFIFPDALALGNIRFIGNMADRVFGQYSSSISITREKPLSKAHLTALLIVYSRALHQREFFSGRKNDLLSLQMRFIEALYNDEDDDLLEAYRKLLKFIRTRVKAGIDEVHIAFLLKLMLNYPIGRKATIRESFATLILDCAHCLCDPDIKEFVSIQSPFQKELDSKIYYERVMPLLARKMSRSPLLGFSDIQAKEFVDYVCNPPSLIPQFIMEHPRKGEIGIVVGVLRELLANALINNVLNVNYGVSQEGKGEFARPNRANKTPDETATFQNPFEAALKTCLLFLHQRLNLEQTVKLVVTLYQMGEKARKKAGLARIDDTPEGRAFSEWTQGRSLLGDFSPEAMKKSRENKKMQEEIQSIINKSDGAILSYVRLFVIPQIKYYVESISHNAHHFASMFAQEDSFYGMTGSPNRDSTFPLGTKVLWDPGTTGEFIHHVMKKCSSPESFIQLGLEDPKLAIGELLHSLFKHGSKMHAIVDAGALFRGLTNEEVAEEIIHFIREHRPDIEGVVFFNNKKELVLFEKINRRMVSFEESLLAPEKRITFYDHGHFYGADISQKADGGAAITLSEKQDIENLLQSTLRMRKFITGEQIAVYVLNSTVKKALFGEEEPNIRALITKANINEGIAQGMENYRAAQVQTYALRHRAVLDTILFAPNIKSARDLFKEFLRVLITKRDLNPFDMYAYPKIEIPPVEALNRLKRSVYHSVSKSPLFTDVAKAGLLEALNSVGSSVYPERVSFYVAPEEIASDVVSMGFDIGQKVHETQEQEQEQEQELENQRQLDLTESIGVNPRKKLSLKVAPWSERIDYFASLDWLRIERDPRVVTLSKVILYHVEGVVGMTRRGEMASIAPAFSGRMLWSSNALGFLDQYRTALVDPFSRLRKPIHHLLVVRHGTEIHSIAIDQREAVFWRKKALLNQEKLESNRAIQIGIYDLGLDQIICCGKNKMRIEELLLDREFCFDIARWKFLAGYVNIRFRRKYSAGESKVIAERDEEILIRYRAWLERHGFERMKHAYLSIHKDFSIQEPEGSDLEYLFEKRSKIVFDRPRIV